MALRTVGHGHSGTSPSCTCQKKFLLVATDYFSKWVEAEAYPSIKDKDVTKFVWKNIICRFGIPQTIIADNGPQFDSITFRNFCSELNIRNSYSTPRYPQSNGQAEATNKTLINVLKKRLEQAKGNGGGATRCPMAYRTTPGRPTGILLSLSAYGMDAVIPTEIGLPTIRTDAAKQSDANMELGRNLDWTDEVRESAAIRMADYQQRASAHYNRKVDQEASKMLQIFPLFLFDRNFCPELPHLPLQTGHLICCLKQRASIDSSRTFASAKSTRRASFSLRAVDMLASPPPISGANGLQYLWPSGEDLHIVRGPQQVSEKIVLIGHATETTHQLQTNSQARKAKLEITHQNDNQKAQKQFTVSTISNIWVEGLTVGKPGGICFSFSSNSA
ncbi:Gag-Pol polyprotein [Vitis vinifera]|uniref:Gag-Pol polyprotein n=1 Tax=Vitis vinifera TaxID=29760 RepID=A0A438KBX7_VITVI|nr:Gag-Pol polyprotein [Vitis vinifera]